MKALLALVVLMLYINTATSQAFYTIIDDDAGSVESVNALKELADRKEIKISFAPIAQNLQWNKVLADTLLSYESQGFHVCNHSYSHSSSIWSGYDLLLIRDDMLNAVSVLDSLGFANHDYFVYPFGKFENPIRDSILELSANNFKLAFNSRGGYNDFKKGNFNKYYINRFPFRSHNDWFAEKAMIDKAIKDSSWIVILTHSHHPDFSLDGLERLIDYCQAKDLKAYTVHQAYLEKVQFERSYPVSDDFGIVDEAVDVIFMHRFSLAIFCVAILSCVWLVVVLSESIRRKER